MHGNAKLKGNEQVDKDSTMAEYSCFNLDHPMCKAMEAMGYMPPSCRKVTIELEAWEMPVIKIEAFVTPDMAAWIEHLREAKVELTIIDVGGRLKEKP